MKYNPIIVLAYFRQCGLPEPVREHQFHADRKWRFDFAWLNERIALEVEGGIFIAGRHSRGSGVVQDMEKYNAAAVLGWRVIRVQPKELTMQNTVNMIRSAMRWPHP